MLAIASLFNFLMSLITACRLTPRVSFVSNIFCLQRKLPTFVCTAESTVLNQSIMPGRQNSLRGEYTAYSAQYLECLKIADSKLGLLKVPAVAFETENAFKIPNV